MAIYRARIEFLPSYHIMYKNKNNIHDRFVSAQPHSLQLSGGKNDLFSPSPLRGSGRKCHFCLPQAEVNSVVPRQNERECYILKINLRPVNFKSVTLHFRKRHVHFSKKSTDFLFEFSRIF